VYNKTNTILIDNQVLKYTTEFVLKASTGADHSYITTPSKNSEQINMKVNKRPRWNKDTAAKFVIVTEKVDNIQSKLPNMAVDVSSVTEYDVNMCCDEVNDLLVASAVNAGCFSQNSKTTFTKEKEWYNNSCRKSRNRYYMNKNKFRKSKTESDKVAMIRSSKAYKKELNRAFRNHKKNMVKKLRNLRSSDPKLYWKILNNKGKHSCDIDAEELYNHFSNLASDNDKYTNTNLPEKMEQENEYINRDFSVEEVKLAIKKLKITNLLVWTTF
jgi:hypothetical protein